MLLWSHVAYKIVSPCGNSAPPYPTSSKMCTQTLPPSSTSCFQSTACPSQPTHLRFSTLGTGGHARWAVSSLSQGPCWVVWCCEQVPVGPVKACLRWPLHYCVTSPGGVNLLLLMNHTWGGAVNQSHGLMLFEATVIPNWSFVFWWQ